VLESTGVLQKTRIYEMSSNQTFRETLAFLIVRDNAHQNAFAKALETLGVEWGKLFPIPNYDKISILNVESLLKWAITILSLILG
jgi:Mn-containing catalase